MLKTRKYVLQRARAILLIIRNRQGWHYLAVKTLSALSKRITSGNYDDFYCLNYLHSFRTKRNLNHVKKYVKIKIFIVLGFLLKNLDY